MSDRERRLPAPVDAKDALAVVQHVYACALAPGTDLWDAVLVALANFFGVARAAATTVAKPAGRLTLHAILGFDRREIESAFRRFGLGSDPLYRAALARPAYSTFHDGEALPPAEERRRSPFYEILGSPDRIEHVLAGVLRNDGEALVVISFWRTADGDSFNAHERETLAWFMPHIGQAHEIRARVVDGDGAAARAHATATPRGLDGRHGLVVLDAAGNVLLANAEAGRILGDGAPLQIARNRLTSTEPALRERLEQARNGTLGTGGTGGARAPATAPILRVPRAGAGLPFEIQVLPAAGRELLPPGAATVVVLTDPDTVLRVAPGRLQALGLTAAEARLCEALVRTGALPRAAAEIGISHGTARSHLKAIFGKLGVSTQIELVQVLVSGAGEHGGR